MKEGNSVVDYNIISKLIYQRVRVFKVCFLTDYSDHCPLSLRITSEASTEDSNPAIYGNINIGCLIYADDLVILTENKSGMQQSLNKRIEKVEMPRIMFKLPAQFIRDEMQTIGSKLLYLLVKPPKLLVNI